MKLREERELTNIKLTESTDGIWIHFDAPGAGLSAGVRLSEFLGHGGVVDRAIQNWAREQLDKQALAHRRFYLAGKLVRPSPPRDGGY